MLFVNIHFQHTPVLIPHVAQKEEIFVMEAILLNFIAAVYILFYIDRAITDLVHRNATEII